MSDAMEILGWMVVVLLSLMTVSLFVILWACLLMAMEIPWLIADAFRWACGLVVGSRGRGGQSLDSSSAAEPPPVESAGHRRPA